MAQQSKKVGKTELANDTVMAAEGANPPQSGQAKPPTAEGQNPPQAEKEPPSQRTDQNITDQTRAPSALETSTSPSDSTSPPRGVNQTSPIGKSGNETPLHDWNQGAPGDPGDAILYDDDDDLIDYNDEDMLKEQEEASALRREKMNLSPLHGPQRGPDPKMAHHVWHTVGFNPSDQSKRFLALDLH